MTRDQGSALMLGTVVSVVSIALAYWARYGLVEVDGLEAACAQSPQQLRCVLRMAVIHAFQEHRLGGGALIFAGVAAYTGRIAWALIGLALAGTGLVLYDADLSAVAWVAAALALQGAAGRAPKEASGQPGAAGSKR